jgi:hypothetical protein
MHCEIGRLLPVLKMYVITYIFIKVPVQALFSFVSISESKACRGKVEWFQCGLGKAKGLCSSFCTPKMSR